MGDISAFTGVRASEAAIALLDAHGFILEANALTALEALALAVAEETMVVAEETMVVAEETMAATSDYYCFLAMRSESSVPQCDP